MCIGSCPSPCIGVSVLIIAKFLWTHKYFLTQPPVPSGLCFSFLFLDYIYFVINYCIKKSSPWRFPAWACPGLLTSRPVPLRQEQGLWHHPGRHGHSGICGLWPDLQFCAGGPELGCERRDYQRHWQRAPQTKRHRHEGTSRRDPHAAL